MKRQAGFGKFEFAVVLGIFGILAGALVNRLIAIEHETEQLEVALTIRHIHVGLKLAIGEKIMRGREDEIAALLDRNPLDFLGDAKEQTEKVGAGETARWRFDPARRQISYRPRQPEAFDGRAELRWQFVGHRDERGRMVGLRLEPLK
ncbi:hypothetical protein MASR1M60_06700 [Rhodocyclaceae bacterium]